MLAASAWAGLCGPRAFGAEPSVAPPGLSLPALVQEALQQNRPLQGARLQLERARGQVLVADGAFDRVVTTGLVDQRTLTPLTDAAQASLNRSQLTTQQLAWSAGVRQPLRSGGAVVASGEWGHLREQTALNLSTPGNPYASLGFTVDLPLGRGRGEREVGADARAAELNRRAAVRDVGHQAAVSVLQVAQQYWVLHAAERRLELARQIEARSAALIDQLRRLIEKEQVPAYELNLARANSADKVSLRVAAEQSLREARTGLAKLLGRDSSGMPALQAATVEGFPEVLAGPAAESLAALSRSWADRARDRRLDLAAERLRRDSLQEAAVAATDRLRPDVSVQLGLRYRSIQNNGPRTDLLQAPTGNWAGPSAVASVQYRWPVEGRQVRGEVMDRQAQLERQQVRLQELADATALDIDDALRNLLTTAALVRSADAAVADYQATVAAERRRYALGTATLKNVLDTEDRLDAAVLRSISQRQDYGRALARLWFELGELVVPEGDDAERFQVPMALLLGDPLAAAPYFSVSPAAPTSR